MNKVLITNESRFPVNRKVVREAIQDFLTEKKIKSQLEVSILVVGDRKMKELNKKYRGLEGTTPVLTFSQDEGKAFVQPPDGFLRLGDIVISYPQMVAMAASENKLTDLKMVELVCHGLANLFGLSPLS